MRYTFKPKGICATRIQFDIEGNVVRNISFSDGCNGNLKAIAKLLDGMSVEDISEKCGGNTCGLRKTSCADQLSIAVREALAASERTPS